MSVFPQNFYTFILQLFLFHTRWDTVSNYIITTAILIHFIITTTILIHFIRRHLDYSDVIFDQHYNNSFHQKLDSTQYDAALAITGAVGGSSMEKLC